MLLIYHNHIQMLSVFVTLRDRNKSPMYPIYCIRVPKASALPLYFVVEQAHHAIASPQYSVQLDTHSYLATNSI